MGLSLFLLDHLFYLSQRKTRWTMSLDNRREYMSIVNLELHDHCDVFPWFKLKWSRDKFNSQS